jgi:hypothetical protein
MLEDQAALGVVALILFVIMVTFGFMNANVISNAIVNTATKILKTRAAILSLVILMMFLLIYGVASFGLINSLPSEQHVERNRENNRMILSEDKDGCLDMRTLGRSNGVYLSLKPCKTPDKKDGAEK